MDYHTVPVEDGGWPVSDVVTEKETAALMRTLYRVVLAEKRDGRLVHLSIAGGRKTMSVYGMVVAQLLFDDNDRVWHVLSEDWQPGNERVMHPRPGDRVSLLPVPVLRWSAVSPVLTELAVREDPWEVIQAQRFIRQEEDHHRKRENNQMVADTFSSAYWPSARAGAYLKRSRSEQSLIKE